MSDSLQPHGLQHARPPCPSPSPGVYSNSCPSSRWCPPTISSSVVPFSSCPQSLPASEFFPMSQLFAWGGQRTGVSALASFLPKKSQGWSPLGWIGWISLQSKGLSRVFSDTTVQNHKFFGAQLPLIVQRSHPYMTTGKTIALTRRTFVGKVMSLPGTCLGDWLSSPFALTHIAPEMKNHFEEDIKTCSSYDHNSSPQNKIWLCNILLPSSTMQRKMTIPPYIPGNLCDHPKAMGQHFIV